ncbi:MAG: glycine cleavage system protein GcvH [Rhodothermales bacterium]
MEFPDQLRYSKDHEWIRVEADGKTAVIGISEFAQSELGDIVFVELYDVDEHISKDATFGTVEAVKTVSDLIMPVSGTIIAHNDELEDSPELINNSSYDSGWMIKITMDSPSEVNDLMTAADYAEMVGQ